MENNFIFDVDQFIYGEKLPKPDEKGRTKKWGTERPHVQVFKNLYLGEDHTGMILVNAFTDAWKLEYPKRSIEEWGLLLADRKAVAIGKGAKPANLGERSIWIDSSNPSARTIAVDTLKRVFDLVLTVIFDDSGRIELSDVRPRCDTEEILDMLEETGHRGFMHSVGTRIGVYNVMRNGMRLDSPKTEVFGEFTNRDWRNVSAAAAAAAEQFVNEYYRSGWRWGVANQFMGSQKETFAPDIEKMIEQA